jgi:hypothetical protein
LEIDLLFILSARFGDRPQEILAERHLNIFTSPNEIVVKLNELVGKDTAGHSQILSRVQNSSLLIIFFESILFVKILFGCRSEELSGSLEDLFVWIYPLVDELNFVSADRLAGKLPEDLRAAHLEHELLERLNGSLP